jgi:hypothetical protein
MIDHQYEQELAAAAEKAKALLFQRLEPSEQKTTRRYGSADPDTFEDKARAISQNLLDPRARDVERRLHDFQAAINRLWEYALNEGIIQRLARTWLSRNKGVVGAVDFAALVSEATFAVRKACLFFSASRKTNLETYARSAVFQALSLYVAREFSPVDVSVAVAEGRNGFDPLPQRGDFLEEDQL